MVTRTTWSPPPALGHRIRTASVRAWTPVGENFGRNDGAGSRRARGRPPRSGSAAERRNPGPQGVKRWTRPVAQTGPGVRLDAVFGRRGRASAVVRTRYLGMASDSVTRRPARHAAGRLPRTGVRQDVRFAASRYGRDQPGGAAQGPGSGAMVEVLAGAGRSGTSPRSGSPNALVRVASTRVRRQEVFLRGRDKAGQQRRGAVAAQDRRSAARSAVAGGLPSARHGSAGR